MAYLRLSARCVFVSEVDARHWVGSDACETGREKVSEGVRRSENAPAGVDKACQSRRRKGERACAVITVAALVEAHPADVTGILSVRAKVGQDRRLVVVVTRTPGWLPSHVGAPT